MIKLGTCGALLLVLLAGCSRQTPEEMFVKGFKAFEQGDLIGAALYLDKFIEKYPEHKYTPRAHLYLANCRAGLGDDELPDDLNRKYQDTFIEYTIP